jgi:hypothetical protein
MNVQVTKERNVMIPLDSILGSFRTFGPAGPVYEVLAITGPSTGNDVMLSVRLVVTGETITYPLADVLDDPIAR